MRAARVAAIGLAALVVGVTAGLAVNRGSEAPAAAAVPAPEPAARATVSTGPGPSSTSGGMPIGFAHDEAGARAAAMAYASASQRWLYLSDEDVELAVAAISTEVAGPGLTREVLEEVRVARESLAASAGRVWWIVRPVAVRVETYAAQRARVAVWTVTVLSASDVALPQSDWVTATVDLAWERGDWRVDGIVDVPGPTPMIGPRDDPWQPEPFDDALAGFERVNVGSPS